MRDALMVSSAVCLVAATALLTAPASVRAQRRGADNSNEGAPVSTTAIVQGADAYYGQPVTVSAGVEQVLSKTAFVLDQRRVVRGQGVKSAGAPILVIAPYLTGVLTPADELVVRGEIVKFAPADLARAAPEYSLDVPDDAAAAFAGKPVLMAISVRNSSFTEIGMKPVRPPTPEESSMSAAMKAISAALADLQSATQDTNSGTAAQEAAKLRTLFIETEAIWNKLDRRPVAVLAREAGTHAASIEQRAAANDWAAAKASSDALESVCQTCHRAAREAQDDGTFRFKAGS